MRDIKFRGKRKNGSEWLIGDLLRSCNGGPCIFPNNTEMLNFNSPDWFEVDPETVGQYTGLKDKNGKEIYEGDVFRIEETDQDGNDEFIYIVITWVDCWCMFASLTIDEYHEYNLHGGDILDEPSFWTYTLEDTNSVKHFLCGNIYENPELLTDAL